MQLDFKLLVIFVFFITAVVWLKEMWKYCDMLSI